MAVLKGAGLITAAILIIMLASYWAAGRARPLLDASIRDALQKQGVAHSFVELGDGWIHYRLEGPEMGPLVVFVHGFSVPSFVFDDYVAPLTAAGYRVLAFDNYGRGFSDRPRAVYDADLTDRLIVDLLDKLGLGEPAHLVGYSMGGAAAVIFAARHPDRLRSLTLIAPAGLGVASNPNVDLIKRPLIGDWIVRMFGLKIFHGIAAEESKIAPDPTRFLADFDRQMDYRGYGDALLSAMRHYPLATSAAAFEEAGRSPRPVLVVWGEADRTVPFVHAKKLMELMPLAKLHSYPGVGHDIAFSQAPMVTDLIVEFFAAQNGSLEARRPAERAGIAANAPDEAGQNPQIPRIRE